MNDVTVVIPVYNRRGLLTRTLDSVAAQTRRPETLVIVDNNSTDGSLDVARRWATEHADGWDVRVVTESRPGASAARNRGLAEVSTRWVMFFDSDDIMLPGHVERAVATADANPAADIIGWDILDIKPDGRRRRFRFITADPIFNNLRHSTMGTQRYMARTALVRHVGGWNESTRMYDDCELGMRLLLQRPRPVYAGAEITVELHEQPESITHGSTDRIASMTPALDAIERLLPEASRHWVDLQRLIMCAGWAACDPGAAALVHDILARQPLRRRLAWWLLYHYTRGGGRGAARIYRLLS